MEVRARWPRHGGTRRVLVSTGLIGVLLGGCTIGTPVPTPPGTPGAATAPGSAAEPVDVTSADRLMLDDLARALEQLHAPHATTVQVARDADALTRALAERLATAGYGVRQVDADQGAFPVVLSASDAGAAEGAPATRLELSVGSTELARSYRRRTANGADAGVVPASALSVGGTRGTVDLDDARFGAGVEQRHEKVVRVASAGLDEPLPLISLVTGEIVADTVGATVGDVAGNVVGTPLGDRARGPSLAAVNSQKIEVPNLYYEENEAFGTMAGAREPAESAVVIFADDSMRLGPNGKRTIAQFIETYREDTDLIGLIGCSNGPTALDIGNEGLALGRSRRVVEELVSLGIAAERILDEGCWAPTAAGDRFPSRGVMMELLRSPS